MRVIYSPWMKEFLEAVSSVQEEILLVCPFIKLNLVELLLRKLPDSSIKIDVLTRLSLWDFQHSASDLDALDLLAKRPGAPGPTRIYRLNRLHAKVYIFDRERVFLGSSNLSVSGLDKNLEIVASVHDRKAADLLYRELGRLKAFGYELDEPDFLEMRRRLAETPAPPEALSDSTIPPEDVALELEEIVAGTAPALIDTTLETPTAKEREQKIGGFLSERARPELNCLKGKPFESTVFQADLSDNGQREQLQKIWHEAAQRDAERIRRELLPVLGLPSFADLDGAMT